jgi:hypothetical protein
VLPGVGPPESDRWLPFDLDFGSVPVGPAARVAADHGRVWLLTVAVLCTGVAMLALVLRRPPHHPKWLTVLACFILLVLVLSSTSNTVRLANCPTDDCVGAPAVSDRWAAGKWLAIVGAALAFVACSARAYQASRRRFGANRDRLAQV